MYRVYGDSRSGNCYKVAWLMQELALPYEWVEVDILEGGTRHDTFLGMNPNGKIPLLDLGDGRFLAESNAILGYLSENTPLLPVDRFHRALVYQWLFFEQYSHEPYIATSRFIVQYLGSPANRADELSAKQEPGNKALKIMDSHLSTREFLTGDHFTIADIALYAYTHVADEGGFDLSLYPFVQAWLRRAEIRPGYLPMSARTKTA
ncbi:MAG: glutathione S-transferase family protein [Pseudomonadota bacterium]